MPRCGSPARDAPGLAELTELGDLMAPGMAQASDLTGRGQLERVEHGRH